MYLKDIINARRDPDLRSVSCWRRTTDDTRAQICSGHSSDLTVIASLPVILIFEVALSDHDNDAKYLWNFNSVITIEGESEGTLPCVVVNSAH